MLNFRYAAYSYLNEYLRVDKPCIDALASDRSSEAICKALSRMAVIYNINRNLAIQTERWRFERAHVLLMKVEEPLQGGDVAKTVEALSIKLGQAYRRESGTNPKLVSAASKFLWMRFRSPVVMYDRYAWQWIRRKNDLARTGSYADFLSAWRKKYDESKQLIASDCEAILHFQSFTLAKDMPPSELETLVGQNWFRERVFDHAIIDAEQKREAEKQARKEARDSAG